MDIVSIVRMEAIKSLYYLFHSDKKERVEMILEPLQAMTQLAVMTYCPVGSKLSISNNLLCIQIPSWTQSVTRSYNHDKKDDLFFLFSVINRFNSFYLFLKGKQGKTSELFDILVDMSKTGLDKIIQTYSRGGGDYTHLLQTLKMYRKMLERPDVFTEKAISGSGGDHKDKEHNKDKDHKDKDKEKEKERKIELPDKDKNIDGIFVKISELYTEEHLSIICNTLKLIKKNPQDCVTYMDGLNFIFHPVNVEIKKWIHENIVF